MKKVYGAWGRYQRRVIVEKGEGKCYQCKDKKEILSFDSSDDEYSRIKFCIECLIDFSKGNVSKNPFSDVIDDE